LHEQILAEAVKLPDEENLFILQDNHKLGNFSWNHWLFKLK